MLVIFGVATLSIHALHAFAVRSGDVRGPELGSRGRGVRHPRWADEDPALRLLGGIWRDSRRAARHADVPVHRQERRPYVTLFWLAIAVTFGIRRPGGALLAGFALAGSPAIFHWLATDILPQGSVTDLMASTYFVPILSGLGAINLAQEPDGILALSASNASPSGGRRTARRARAEARPSTAAKSPSTNGRTAPRCRRGAAPDTTGRATLDALLSLDRSLPATATSRCCTVSRSESPRGTIVALLGRQRSRQVDVLRASPAGLVEPTPAPSVDGDDVTGDAVRPRARSGRAARARGARHLPRPHGRGELRRAVAGPALRGAGLRPVPDPARAAQAAGRTALGRRATDAQPRARCWRSRPKCSSPTSRRSAWRPSRPTSSCVRSRSSATRDAPCSSSRNTPATR